MCVVVVGRVGVARAWGARTGAACEIAKFQKPFLLTSSITSNGYYHKGKQVVVWYNRRDCL